MPAEVRPIVPLLAYQRADVESAARFTWCCWSRQTGKSFTKALRRVLRGLQRGRTQLLLSAGERQSRELMTKVRQHCQTLQIATQLLEEPGFAGTRYGKLEVALPGGVRIIGLPANPRTVRGFSGDVLLDEFALHADDREIWAAMFPTVLRGGGELDVASTPRGCRNVFAQLRDNPRFTHSTVTLPQAIAAGLDVDLAEMRRSMGDEELFRQEFLCEFLDESTAFLSLAAITACEDENLDKHTPLAELAALPGDLYAGVDLGRRHDLTVIWVVQAVGRTLVTRRVIELANCPFREQYARLSAVLGLRHLRRCALDAGGLGMQLGEQAQADFGSHRVETVTFTVGVKAELAGRLRVAVEDQRIRIPADEAIRNDWHALQRSVTTGGQIRLDAGRREGHHADRFWAAALAVQAADDAPGPAEMLTVRPMQYARSGTW